MRIAAVAVLSNRCMNEETGLHLQACETVKLRRWWEPATALSMRDHQPTHVAKNFASSTATCASTMP